MSRKPDPYELPDGLRDRVHGDVVGRVEQIVLRPRRDHPAVATLAWDLGGAADHAPRDGRRAVTLVQSEHLPAIAALLGRPVDPLRLRRNLVIAGINLRALMHGRFAVGDAVLRGSFPCDPCDQMDEALGAGGFMAMVGMGGICAAIESFAVIRAGDPVRWLG